MNQNQEQLIFFYILSHPEFTEVCKKNFFATPLLGEMFELAKPFVIKYKKAPTAAQMIQTIEMSEISQELRVFLTSQTILQFWRISETLESYEEDWLLNSTKAFLKWNKMVDGLKNIIAFVKIKDSELSVDNYEDIINQITFMLNNDTVVDFNDVSAGVSLYDPEAHKTKELNRWSTGYSFLDRGSKGGYWAGSLWVFLGAPKAGKSRLLQNLAAQSIKLGHNCAYASFELQEEIVTQRIGANLFNIKMDDYDVVADDTNLMNQKIRSFLHPDGDIFAKERGELDIKSFPTSAFSVPELEAWLLKEEKRLTQLKGKDFKFKNVFVDYINIMKNWRNPNSENTYMKIKQIAEDLRAMAMRNGWCVISVTQVKASFFNAGDIDMTAASESSALSATVDFMGGIITDIIAQASHYLFLKTILSRVTPNINERKKFLIEEEYMRLVESTEPIIHDEDLQESFVDKSKQIINNYRNGQGKKNNTQKPQQPEQSASSGMNINPSKTVTITPNLNASVSFTGEGLFT